MRKRLNDAAGASGIVPGGSTPLGSMATADQIPHSVIWLCSWGANHITGQTITIDGGLTV